MIGINNYLVGFNDLIDLDVNDGFCDFSDICVLIHIKPGLWFLYFTYCAEIFPASTEKSGLNSGYRALNLVVNSYSNIPKDFNRFFK